MDEKKIEQLIEEVHSKPIIWNKLLNGNRSKNIVGKEWDKIAAKLRVIKTQAQRKWKTLVNKFKTEHSLVQLHCSGDSSGDSYTSDWPHYQSMSFLGNSAVPNSSSGNLEFLDVKPPLNRIVIKDSSSENLDPNMPKNDYDIHEQILRFHKEKCAVLESSLPSNIRDISSAEKDKLNMAFFETLLPPLREVSKEAILMCRNDVSQVIFKYAFKHAEWKSVNPSLSAYAPLSNPTPTKRRRKLKVDEDDDDCRIVSYSSPQSTFKLPSSIKREQKYEPTALEREMEHRTSEMTRPAYAGCRYPPQPPWNWDHRMYQQQFTPYPAQRYFHPLDNQEWQGHFGIPRPVPPSNSSLSPNSATITSLLPETQPVPTTTITGHETDKENHHFDSQTTDTGKGVESS